MENSNTDRTPVWVKQARKRAESRNWEPQRTRSGKTLLSFWVEQAPRPEFEVEEAE